MNKCVHFRESLQTPYAPISDYWICIRTLNMLVFYGGENLHAMTNNNKVEIEVQHGTNCTFIVCKLYSIFQNDIEKDAKQ